MSKLAYHDIGRVVGRHSHGLHSKDLIVLHETVSPDVAGWSDIDGVVKYLADKDYGIHGMTDAEGHIAWARGYGKAVFWQAGGVNERSIGIEQVSRVMLKSPSNVVRRHIWTARNAQLRATAKLVAAISNTWRIPLKASNGLTPGVCGHWNVSQHYSASEGHYDCWPVNDGGYYPLSEVLRLARAYAATGITL